MEKMRGREAERERERDRERERERQREGERAESAQRRGGEESERFRAPDRVSISDSS